MNHKIAFVAATDKEIEPLLNYLRSHAEQHSFQTFQLHGLLIDIIYTGIGILKTTYTLMDYPSPLHYLIDTFTADHQKAKLNV